MSSTQSVQRLSTLIMVSLPLLTHRRLHKDCKGHMLHNYHLKLNISKTNGQPEKEEAPVPVFIQGEEVCEGRLV